MIDQIVVMVGKPLLSLIMLLMSLMMLLELLLLLLLLKVVYVMMMMMMVMVRKVWVCMGILEWSKPDRFRLLWRCLLEHV